MRDLRPAVLALLLGTVLVGCSEKGDGASASSPSTPGEPSASDSAAAWTGEVIADGSYAKTATVTEARAMGITDQSFLDQLGEDGKTSFVFKFAGDRWTLFVVEDAPEPGDLGTLQYDARGDAVMTSESDGCPGCVFTYDWALAGDVLTLTVVGHEATDAPEDVQMVRFVTEGAFTRQS